MGKQGYTIPYFRKHHTKAKTPIKQFFASESSNQKQKPKWNTALLQKVSTKSKNPNESCYVPTYWALTYRTGRSQGPILTSMKMKEWTDKQIQSALCLVWVTTKKVKKAKVNCRFLYQITSWDHLAKTKIWSFLGSRQLLLQRKFQLVLPEHIMSFVLSVYV